MHIRSNHVDRYILSSPATFPSVPLNALHNADLHILSLTILSNIATIFLRLCYAHADFEFSLIHAKSSIQPPVSLLALQKFDLRPFPYSQYRSTTSSTCALSSPCSFLQEFHLLKMLLTMLPAISMQLQLRLVEVQSLMQMPLLQDLLSMSMVCVA